MKCKFNVLMSVVLTLIVFRHGKSSWEDDSLDDTERPLKKRGKKDAKLMAKMLRDEKHIQFEQVLTSHARRARDTCKIACKYCFKEGKPTEAKKLYFCGVDAILKVIREKGKEKTLAIFGHNPDFSDFVARCPGGDKYSELTTSGVAIIEFACKYWEDVSFDNAHVVTVDSPKKTRERQESSK